MPYNSIKSQKIVDAEICIIYIGCLIVIEQIARVFNMRVKFLESKYSVLVYGIRL